MLSNQTGETGKLYQLDVTMTLLGENKRQEGKRKRISQRKKGREDKRMRKNERDLKSNRWSERDDKTERGKFNEMERGRIKQIKRG